MEADADVFELGDCCADIDSVTTQSIELDHDQDIALFHLVNELGDAFSLRNGRGTGYGLCDDAVWLDGESSRLNVLDLVFGYLIKCEDGA